MLHWERLNVSSPILDFLKDAATFAFIGAPAAIVRTLMKKDRTWRDIFANGASCAFVSPLAGWTATAIFPPLHGSTQGLVYVVIGVATLLGKDLIEGTLREGESFRSDPRRTVQEWLTFWRNLIVPGPKA
jgi:hypothetical protein